MHKDKWMNILKFSNYSSTPIAKYQFHGNTKKIPFIPFMLSISKVDALEALDEIDDEYSYLTVLVFEDKIIFENEEHECLWTIESMSPETNKSLSKEYIDFINAEKDGLNLNYLHDFKNNLTIFKESNI